MDQAGVGVQRGFFDQHGAGTAGLFAGEHPCHDATGALGIHLDAYFQEAFALAAVQRQHAVAGNLVQRFGVVVILRVDAVLVLGFGAGDTAERAVVAAQFGTAGGIVGDCFGDDILRTRQCGSGVWDFVVDVVGGGSAGGKGGVLFEQGIRQRLQTARLGDAGAGLALGLVGAVEVLDLGQRFGLGECSGQLGRHSALLGDGGGDFLLALIQPAQVFQTVAKVAQDLVIHRAGSLFAVAGDERNGVALVDQVDRALDIFGGQVQFGSKLLCVIRHLILSF